VTVSPVKNWLKVVWLSIPLKNIKNVVGKILKVPSHLLFTFMIESGNLNGFNITGTVSPDFLPLVFFFKQLLLAPVDKPSNNFDFFRIFAEIFDYFGASPVSTTPVNNSLSVSTTPVSDIFSVLESFTGVIDTSDVMHHRCH
jgi:hypothetical protein